MQAKGLYTSSHNFLTTEDILALHDSSRLSKKVPLGFLTRIMFSLAFLTGWRLGALANLGLAQIQKIKKL